MGRRKKELPNSAGYGQYVDQCNGECWGKQVLHKVHGKNLYYGTCRHECRLKDECIKASREEAENVQYQLATIPYDPAIGDSEEHYNEDGEPIVSQKSTAESSETSENSDEPVNLDDVASEQFSSLEDFDLRFLKQQHIPEELSPAFRELTNQFFMMVHLMPKFTTVLTGAVIAKMTQAELARREGLTRQAVNAAISTEIIKVTAPEICYKKMDGMERVVYDLIRQGYSLGYIAKKMKISKSKVYRVKRNFGAKINKSETKNKIRLPWKKKQQKARQIARWREVQKEKKIKEAATVMLQEMMEKLKGKNQG